MIWIRFVVIAFAILYGIYYFMVISQLFGIIKFTNRKFTFKRCLVTFYYWITNQNEKKVKSKNNINNLI